MICPSSEQISAYLSGNLLDERFHFVAGHLDSCSRCERVAGELDRQSNSPFLRRSVGSIRELPKRQDGPEPKLLLESLDRAQRVGREDTARIGVEVDTRSRLACAEEQIRVLLARYAPSQAPEEVGRFGDLRILNLLGAGGMGVVFRAEDLTLQRYVAVKFLHSSPALPRPQERFLREARAAAAIEDDHVLAIYRVGEIAGVPFLVMPLLKGASLRDRLLAKPQLPLDEVLRIGRETAKGLSAAHRQGLLHRDIKPDNLWLDTEADRVVILDFGLARLAHPSVELTSSDVIVGTPRYMSPEQALGQAADHRCDLFSLGCVLYQMAAGHVPFTGKSVTRTLIAVASEAPAPLETHNPRLPKSFCRLVERLLAKEPQDRYETAAAVVAAIQAVESELNAGQAVSSSSKQPVPATGPAEQDSRRPHWNLPALAAMALLVLVGLGLASLLDREPQRQPGRKETAQPIPRQDFLVQTSDATNWPTEASDERVVARNILKPGDDWLALIPLLDLIVADMQGAFSIEDGVLISGGTRKLLRFPLRINGEYDFEATIPKWFIKDNHHIDLYMPYGNERYPFFRIGIDDANTGTCCSFRSSADGAPRVTLPFSSGDMVRLSLRLRRDGDLLKTSADFDGRFIASCSRRLDGRPGEQQSGQLLLLDLMPGREYRDLRFRMVSGEAEILSSITSESTGGASSF